MHCCCILVGDLSENETDKKRKKKRTKKRWRGGGGGTKKKNNGEIKQMIHWSQHTFERGSSLASVKMKELKKAEEEGREKGKGGPESN